MGTTGNTPKLGIWVDTSFKDTLENIELLKPFDEVALMAQSMNGKWKWAGRDIENLGAALPSRMARILTVWPQGGKKIDPQVEEFDYYANRFNADFIELELEGNVRGASRSWKTDLAHACLQLPYRIEATSFPGHVETSPNAVVTPLLNRVNTQAYSVVNRVDVKGKVTLDHRYGPGHMQEMAIKDALQSPPWERNWNAPVIGVGLALYDQGFEGTTPVKAIRTAFETCLIDDVSKIRFWSFKWLIRNKYARDFVKEIPGILETTDR